MPFKRHPRSVRLRLLDIQEEIANVSRFLEGVTLERFRTDVMVSHAVTRSLEIVSEASRHLPDELKSRHPGIRWADIRDSGNVYRHAYPGVSVELIWNTAIEELPRLGPMIESELLRYPD